MRFPAIRLVAIGTVRALALVPFLAPLLLCGAPAHAQAAQQSQSQSQNIPVPSSAPPDAPAQITTDTATYCALLAAKMERQTEASFDVLALGAQGKALCAEGKIRAGISRLRRALMAARDDPDGGDDVVVPELRENPDNRSASQSPTVVGNDDLSQGGGFFPPLGPRGTGGTGGGFGGPPGGGGPAGGGGQAHGR